MAVSILAHARHDRRCGEREFLGGNEKPLFSLAQMIRLAGQTRGKIDDQGAPGFARAAHALHQFAQAFQADDLAAAGEFEFEQALGQFAPLGVIGIDAHAIAGVIDQQATVALALQSFPQSAQQRHQGGAAGQRHEKTVADVAGDDELRTDRQEPFQVEQPAR